VTCAEPQALHKGGSLSKFITVFGVCAECFPPPPPNPDDDKHFKLDRYLLVVDDFILRGFCREMFKKITVLLLLALQGFLYVSL
jgi:hypothetical protein